VVEVEENPSKKTEEILQLNRLKTRVAEGDRIPLVDCDEKDKISSQPS
jgi:hypothetical protein